MSLLLKPIDNLHSFKHRRTAANQSSFTCCAGDKCTIGVQKWLTNELMKHV